MVNPMRRALSFSATLVALSLLPAGVAVRASGDVVAIADGGSAAGEVYSIPDQAQEQPQAVNASTEPADHHWAVIIGINEYAGSTADAIGSRQDATVLYQMLLRKGWKRSNIRLVLDTDATAKGIVQATRWLARNTTKDSTVIFHYAGHEMPFYSDRDGDGEGRDVALWASDNRYVIDGDLGRLLSGVRAAKMWIHFATCRAGGFNDQGIVKENRIVSYSSRESQLSYEDPAVEHSVLGYYMIVEGMKKKWADANGNGKVTVEEAFRFARKRVLQRTSDRQHPFLVDRLSGAFALKVPAPKKVASEPEPEPSQECTLGICTG